VEFFKEEVTLTVNDSASVVSGIYYFRNNQDYTGVFPVAFPFHIDSLSLYPDSMSAYFVNDTDTLPIGIRSDKSRKMAVLNIPLISKQVTCWHFDYSQKISSSRAVYIITSTASWGKPLEDAIYRFIVPAKFKNITVWPDADTIIIHENYLEYLSHKTNFMPRRDMEIKWEY
jgi:hypothetical protein